MKCLLYALLAVSLSLVGSVRADDKVAEITHDELAKAVKDKKVVLIDCNGSDSFKKNHIPGAVDGAKGKEDIAKNLPKEKDALIVAYCGNENCPAYKSGAKIAQELGYTNVKHYKAGLKGWKDKGEETAKAEK